MAVTRTKTVAQQIMQQSNTLLLLIYQLRPKQWTKNLLIFAALLFSPNVITVDTVANSILGFILFCFTSGCVYILNDYVDREADSKHPVKKNRPMASGELNPYVALSFGVILLVSSSIIAYFITPVFMILLLLYFIMNISYSLKLKHVVIVDVMIIAAGFVIRAIVGGVVIHVPFTPWFLMCTMLLSLFLAISKRRQEVILLNTDRGVHRKVLEKYSSDLLDQLNSVVTTATIISYSLFTFTSGHTVQLMWTIPFVLYGVFRYLYLIHAEGQGGSPEKILLEDKHILITVILYVTAVVLILGLFD